MTVLAFTPDRNSPSKPADYSGAFKPEAQRFCTLFGGRRFEIPLTRSFGYQLDMVTETIRASGHIDVVGFFCHGFTNRLQFAYTNSTVGKLADVLAEVHCDRVALYACSTGGGKGPGGDGGFADILRDRMCERGLTDCRVMGHEVSGHTTTNRCKRFFDGMGSPVGGTGGYDVVARKSKLWSAWSRRVRDTKDMLRFRIMTMSIAEIHQELSES